MLKVMLINPPQTYFEKSGGFSVYFPIGLLSIAAVIRKACNVKIFDCLISDFEVKKEGDMLIYGTPAEKIKNAIEEFGPDVVGITIPFSTQISNAVEISRICRDVNPKIKVIFGGPHTSVRYNKLLKDDLCDLCVVGEGEETFLEFVEKLKSGHSVKGVAGLAYKERGRVYYKPRRFIDNLDDLPLPAYNLINVNDYIKSPYLYIDRSRIHKNSISMITSRGCPYNCVFCSIRLHMGQGFRHNSPEYVIKHIKLLIERYGIRNFHFEDDNISFSAKRFERILDEIINNKIKIKWDTPNGIRADTLNKELLNKIKKSGCKELIIAIESGSQRVLDDVIRKKTSLDKIMEVIRECKRLGIKLSSFYVIGFPGESIKEMRKTADLALMLLRSYDVIPNLFVATPLYGTDLYNTCVEEGIISKDITEEEFLGSSSINGESLISTKDFSKDDIKDILRYYKEKRKKELLSYYIRHPFHSAEIIMNKPVMIKRLFRFLSG